MKKGEAGAKFRCQEALSKCNNIMEIFGRKRRPF